jgi:hypothetical protein
VVSSGTIIYPQKAAKKRCSKVVFRRRAEGAPFLLVLRFFLDDFHFFPSAHFPRAAADPTQNRRLLVLLVTFWFSADATTIHNTSAIIERNHDDARSLKKKSKKKKKIQPKRIKKE